MTALRPARELAQLICSLNWIDNSGHSLRTR